MTMLWKLIRLVISNCNLMWILFEVVKMYGAEVSVSKKELDNTVNIKEFYKSRNILMSGATGFLGKVFLEKLLRSCEDIGNIYVVIRPKKGKTVDERLQHILSLPIFERVHKERPDAIKKVVAIEGDISDPAFSLHERDQKIIEDLVSVVFHIAATVKFDEELKLAVNTNIRGTKHMIDIAKYIKELKAFVYVSTAYSNSDRPTVEEEYYVPKAPPGFWKDLIIATEIMDEHVLNALTPSLIGKLPNTYTFTKQLAESLVYDHKDIMPVAIFRPSIVMGTFKEPVPGWVDTYSGPTGLMLAYYVGLLSVAMADVDCRNDYVGVDYVVNGLVAVGAERGHSCDTDECMVFNSAMGKYSKKIDFLFEMMLLAGVKVPAERRLWKPKMIVTKRSFFYHCYFFLCHLIPALFLEIILKASGIKFSLLQAYRKIYTNMKVIQFFLFETIDFKHDKILELHAKLTPEEKEIFYFDVSDTSDKVEGILEVLMFGVKKYMLKEETSQEAIEKLTKRKKFYTWADLTVKTIFGILLFKMVKPFAVTYIGYLYDLIY